MKPLAMRLAKRWPKVVHQPAHIKPCPTCGSIGHRNMWDCELCSTIMACDQCMPSEVAKKQKPCKACRDEIKMFRSMSN